MQNVRKTTAENMKRKKWKKSQLSDTESDSDNSDDSLEYSDTDDTNNSASLRKPIDKQNTKTKSTKKEVSFLLSVKQKEKRIKAIPQFSNTSNTNQDTKMNEMM